MIGGVTTLINGIIYTTMTNCVGVATMIGDVSAWKIVGDSGCRSCTEVASVDLVDSIGLPMKYNNCF